MTTGPKRTRRIKNIEKQETTTPETQERDKVFDFTISFTDRVVLDGKVVAKDEEDAKTQLTTHPNLSDKNDLTIDELTYLGTISELVAQMKPTDEKVH